MTIYCIFSYYNYANYIITGHLQSLFAIYILHMIISVDLRLVIIIPLKLSLREVK